jgi:hypothetical protein
MNSGYDRHVSLTSARTIVLISIFGSAAGLALLVAVFPHLGVDLADPVAWIGSAPPEEALAAVGWVLATLLCCYLVVSTVGYAAARLAASERWVRVLSRLVARPVRRSVDLIAAVAVSMATLGPFGELTPGIAHTTSLSVVRTHLTAEPTIVPPGQRSAGYTLAPASSGTDDPGTAETDYEVEPGDNLWTIACRHIREVTAEPTLGQVTEYWLQVIDRNAGGLRSGDPDLIFPGEHIALPALPPERGS